jgi:hypothetical protein
VSTARIEDPHPRRDSSTQNLIEEVDVDLSELVLKIVHGDLPIIRLRTQLIGIALTSVRYAFKNAQTYQNYYPDSNPLLWHMRKVCAPRQTDNQHDETNDVQSE